VGPVVVGSRRPLAWLGGELKTPPLSRESRIEAGFLLRLVQEGEQLGMPHSRVMPSVGSRCHELRINDREQTWRIIYRVDPDAVVILEVFSKKSRTTPTDVVQTCRRRLAAYDRAAKGPKS
jgi:phage-related protein